MTGLERMGEVAKLSQRITRDQILEHVAHGKSFRCYVEWNESHQRIWHL